MSKRNETLSEEKSQGEIRVFVVEDHAMVRDMLCKLIQRTEGLMLCGEAKSAEAGLAGLPAAGPEVILVDLSLPDMDGLAFIQHIHRDYPGVKCLAVSAYLEGMYAHRALAAGARGYLMKDELIEIGEAIRHVYNGGIHISERMQTKLNSQ